VGVGKIRASVNVDYDQGTTDESEEKYDPTVTAVLSSQKSEDESGGAAVPSGVPGSATNIPAGKDAKPAPPNAATQSSKTDSEQFGVNKTVVHTITPAGRIQRITAAILVDDAVVKSVDKGKISYTRRKRTADEINQIKELAEAAIGFDSKRGDSISVQNLSFDAGSTDVDLPAPTWRVEVQKTVSDYSSVLRPVSLLMLFVMAYLFLLRPMQKRVMSAATALPEPLLPAPAQEVLPAGSNQLGNTATRATQLKQETADLIKQKPSHTARAVQAWLHEETQ